jgi:hypothetical protein
MAMKKVWIVSLILALLLAGCGAATQAPATQAPATQALATQTPAANPLGLDPAPFQNGATLDYQWLDANDATIGTSQFQFTLSDGMWTMAETDKIGELDQTIEMRLDAATLQPLGEQKTIRTATQTVVLTTTYESGTLDIAANVNGETRTASLDVPANAVDNDQFLMTLRALPFAQDYATTYTVIVAQNALKVDTTITVGAPVSVTVPAGTYRTWPVELEASGTNQTAWYQIDAPHELIQYNNGATLLQLVSP